MSSNINDKQSPEVRIIIPQDTQQSSQTPRPSKLQPPPRIKK